VILRKHLLADLAVANARNSRLRRPAILLVMRKRRRSGASAISPERRARLIHNRHHFLAQLPVDVNKVEQRARSIGPRALIIPILDVDQCWSGHTIDGTGG